MKKIHLHSNNKISWELADDIGNKISSAKIVLELMNKINSDHAKRALSDLDYIEKKLEKFELKNKLPPLREVLTSLFKLKKPTKESIQKANKAFEEILNVLNQVPEPSLQQVLTRKP